MQVKIILNLQKYLLGGLFYLIEKTIHIYGFLYNTRYFTQEKTAIFSVEIFSL